MSVDFESISDVLKYPIRRKIVLGLYEKKSMSYVDLMNFVGVMNTGKFNYHLKILGDLIEKDKEGRYRLTEKGQKAVQLLQNFPREEKVRPTPLPLADALIIGFIGVVLTVVNPVFWSSALIALLNIELDVPYFWIIGFLAFAYASVVPGAVMWLLSVRRVRFYDMYDLLKPALFSFILLLVILVATLLLNKDLTVTISSPIIQGPQGEINGAHYSTSHQSIMQTSLQMLLFHGLILSFLGVLLAEFASKLRRRIAF